MACTLACSSACVAQLLKACCQHSASVLPLCGHAYPFAQKSTEPGCGATPRVWLLMGLLQQILLISARAFASVGSSVVFLVCE